jgi:xanthine/CO dehydrogenase XdhC/CoxF family maturation factor
MPTARRDARLDTSLEFLLEPAAREVDGVLATLVATAGSTYRKAGARMLILPDGTCHGLLSGGCLEADLGQHANEVLRSRRPRAVEYDMRGPDDTLFGIGAGCEGALRILLEPAGPGTLAAAALAGAGAASRAGSATTLVAVHRADGLELGTYDAVTLAHCAAPSAPQLLAAARDAMANGVSGQFDFDAAMAPDGVPGGRAFVQFLPPSPNLLICGAGPDTQPLANTVQSLGWRVTVVDHRPAYAVAARFPGALVLHSDPHKLAATVPLPAFHAAVVMSHHLNSDVAYLRELAGAGVPDYVGLLGPAARRRRIALELGPAADALSARLRGPVGIDIGAVTPEGIALAIVTEIHAWLAGR